MDLDCDVDIVGRVLQKGKIGAQMESSGMCVVSIDISKGHARARGREELTYWCQKRQRWIWGAHAVLQETAK